MDLLTPLPLGYVHTKSMPLNRSSALKKSTTKQSTRIIINKPLGQFLIVLTIVQLIIEQNGNVCEKEKLRVCLEYYVEEAWTLATLMPLDFASQINVFVITT